MAELLQKIRDFAVSLLTFRNIVLEPDFCRKLSIKYPSSPVITRLDGFVILSDFHSVFSKIKVFKKIFLALAISDVSMSLLFGISYYLLYFAKGSDPFAEIYIRHISDIFENFIVIIKHIVVLLKQTTFCS